MTQISAPNQKHGPNYPGPCIARNTVGSNVMSILLFHIYYNASAGLRLISFPVDAIHASFI